MSSISSINLNHISSAPAVALRQNNPAVTIPSDFKNDSFSKNLSEDEKYFFPEGISNIKIKQGRIGNCQMLSALDAFSKNPTGAEILKNMVKKNPDGKSIDVYFACMEGKPLNVKLDEIKESIKHENSAVHKFFSKLIAPFYKKYYNVENGHERPLGVYAIEHAYAKYMKMSKPNDFKDNKPKNIYDDDDYHSNSAQFMKDATGLDVHTFTTCNEKSKKHDIALETIPKEKKAEMAQILEDAAKNPDNYIITACTTDKSCLGLASWHDYSIRSVELGDNFIEGAKIKIANPWDTSKTKEITIEEFMKNFESISYIKVK